MIPRYESKEISNIWSDQYKFETFIKVELAILCALEETKVIPQGITKKIKETAKINCDRIYEIEEETKHDIIAFSTSITEQLPKEIGKYFHFGVTSSDIIDTAFSIQIKESIKIIQANLEHLLKSLKTFSKNNLNLISLGRSHGMYAEPMSFGQKFLGHFKEFERRAFDYEKLLEDEIRGQFSGAVGNYTILSPEIEELAVKKLDLKPESTSTQIIPRDRYAKIVLNGALLGSAIERIATEIRHLHRSEVGELHEGFSKGQKGSSTMPHKKNPISGENLTGIARVLKSHSQIALENITLWHERDISHSSAERLYLPDHFGLICYSLKRLTSTVDNLIVNKEVINERVADNDSYLSSIFLHDLILKTDLTREEVYKVVQSASFDSKDKGTSLQTEILKQLTNLDIKYSPSSVSHDDMIKKYQENSKQIFNRSFN